MATPDVLDFSAIAPQREVQARIRTKKNPEGLRPDGALYDVAMLEELSPAQIAEFNRGFIEAEQLWGSESLTEPDRERMERLYTDLTAMLILESNRADVKEIPLLNRRALVLDFGLRLSEVLISTMSPKARDAMTRMNARLNGSVPS